MSLIQEFREFLADRDGGQQCYYCHIPLGRNGNRQSHNERSRTGIGVATIDHKVPKMYGGTDHIDNLVLCCSFCNFEKGVQNWIRFYDKKAKTRRNRNRA